MFINLVFFCIIISFLYLGVLVYKKSPQERDNRQFFMMTFWAIMWLLANFLENEQNLGGFRALFLRVDFIVAPFLGFFWFLFCYSFLENKKLKKIYIFILSLVLLLLSILASGDLIIRNFVYSELISFEKGPFFIFYVFWVFVFLGGGVFILFLKYRRLKGVRRVQSLYVLWGFLLGASIGLGINIFFQNNSSLLFFRFGNFSVIFLIVLTAYSIIKHRLFDIRIILQRSAIYLGSFSIILSFYFILLFILNFIFQESLKLNMFVGTIVTIILGIYGVPIIEKYFCRITDKIFFKDKYDFKDAVYSLSEVLNRNISLKKLSAEVSHKIKEILKIKNINVVLPKEFLIFDGEEGFSKCPKEFCRKISEKSLKYNRKIILKEDFNDSFLDQYDEDEKSVIKKIIKKNNVELMVFSFLGDKVNGIFLLGEKLSGDIYSRDDIKLLGTFSYQVASALEKARLYEEVKDYSENLEKKVKERTRQIKELQEEQKQMMLEISHGLQTPLTVIKGKLEDLKIKYSNHEDFKIFEKSLNRISHLIYDMLNLARLEAIDDSFQKEKINLSDLLLDQIEYFEVSLEDKKIKIDYEISPGIYIMGKREKLEELFSNLVSNAAKYMEKSSEKIIMIKAIQEDGEALLSVSDTGSGIEPESLPHMFEKFYRAKNNMPGTGLGLAICKKIMEKHGGKIWLKSKLGEGTEFRMSFPEI